MNSVVNNYNVNYASAKVGVLSAPDKIGKYQPMNSQELNDRYKTITKDISGKQKYLSFEQKKDTPILVKILIGALTLFGLWKLGRRIFKK